MGFELLDDLKIEPRDDPDELLLDFGFELLDDLDDELLRDRDEEDLLGFELERRLPFPGVMFHSIIVGWIQKGLIIAKGDTI